MPVIFLNSADEDDWVSVDVSTEALTGGTGIQGMICKVFGLLFAVINMHCFYKQIS